MNQEQIKIELKNLVKAEEKFISKNCKVKEKQWQEKISKRIPEKLSSTLNTVFCKAFELVFEKGTDFIEKTYNKEKRQQDYKVNEYSADLRSNKSSLQKFGITAFENKTLNMAISAVEGVGMGALGLGIPDIPVFVSVILKSIYEISIDFGFDYEKPEEQLFILKLIEISLCHEDDLIHGDIEINDWIKSNGKILFLTDKKKQIEKTSFVLSQELLYLKFIQGIPIVGAVGGISNVIYQKKITDYALLKYKKRFLLKHMEEDVVM